MASYTSKRMGCRTDFTEIWNGTPRRTTVGAFCELLAPPHRRRGEEQSDEKERCAA